MSEIEKSNQFWKMQKPLLSEPEQDFQLLPVLLIPVNVLKSIFLTSRRNTVFQICTPVVFILTKLLKNTGLTGAAIS